MEEFSTRRKSTDDKLKIIIDEPINSNNYVPAVTVTMDDISKKEPSESINRGDQLFKPPIPKVPLLIRNHENNKGVFDIMVVSIGPYHHGKEDLQLIENVKPIVARLFVLDGANSKNIDEFYNKVLGKVDDARNFYIKGSTEKYTREKFAYMMLLDGCFILAMIENFILHFDGPKSKYDDVRAYLGMVVWNSIFRDIFMLVENQLSFKVLKLLMSLKFEDDDDEGMKRIYSLLTFLIFKDIRYIKNKEKVEVSEMDRQSFHLLQLARAKYLNLNQSPQVLESQMGTKKERDKFHCERLKDYIQYLIRFVKKVTFQCKLLNKFRFVKKYKYSKPKHNLMEYFHSFRSVTKLKAKGIHFRPSSSLSQGSIKFKSGCFYTRLEFHPFIVNPTTKLFFSNMVADESFSFNPKDTIISSYISLLKSLIDNLEDVKELLSNHILFNMLGSDQEVANAYKEITTF